MYCKQSAFEGRFSSKELADLLPEDDGREYKAAAADADALIDSYLAARYTTPLNPVPPLILGIAADILRYKLYDEAPPKEVNARYKDAIKLLEQLRDGDITIPGATTASDAGGVQVSAEDIVMTQCVQKNYMGCL